MESVKKGDLFFFLKSSYSQLFVVVEDRIEDEDYMYTPPTENAWHLVNFCVVGFSFPVQVVSRSPGANYH